jgi:hypothetical protein
MGATPTTSLATLRPDLAGCIEHFNLEADQAGFIAQRVLPVLEVASRSGNFGKILPAQLLQNRDTKRAPNAGYNRSTWQFDDAAYATKEYGAEEAVDDNNAAAYRDYFDAEAIATRRAYDAVLRGMDRVIDRREPQSTRVFLRLSPGQLDDVPVHQREQAALDRLRNALQALPQRKDWDEIIVITPHYRFSEMQGLPSKLHGVGIYFNNLGKPQYVIHERLNARSHQTPPRVGDGD